MSVRELIQESEKLLEKYNSCRDELALVNAELCQLKTTLNGTSDRGTGVGEMCTGSIVAYVEDGRGNRWACASSAEKRSHSFMEDRYFVKVPPYALKGDTKYSIMVTNDSPFDAIVTPWISGRSYRTWRVNSLQTIAINSVLDCELMFAQEESDFAKAAGVVTGFSCNGEFKLVFTRERNLPPTKLDVRRVMAQARAVQHATGRQSSALLESGRECAPAHRARGDVVLGDAVPKRSEDRPLRDIDLTRNEELKFTMFVPQTALSAPARAPIALGSLTDASSTTTTTTTATATPMRT